MRLCFGVSCGIARARSFVCVVAGGVTVHDRGRVVPVPVVATSWPWLWRARRGRPSCRGCVRRAVASLGVAVACRGRGCGVRRLCVAVVWLRHADEC